LAQAARQKSSAPFFGEALARGDLRDIRRSVEENAVLHESGSESVGGSDPFWHLDRIDQRSGTDGAFQYCSGATQVYAYIFDRGVRADDPQLSPRVQGGVNEAPADPTGSNPDTQPPPYPDGSLFNQLNPCGTPTC
jgi:hypothetical protein